MIVSSLVLASCSKDDDTTAATDNWSSVKIAVFSDPHLFDPSLGNTGAAFEEYLAGDRKLIAESYAITESVVNSLLTESPDVVLVTGDLTKDGELKCHQTFATMMKKLTDKGIKVLVIPGNHDVLNPETYSYSGATKTKIANTSANDFSTIYANCGFSSAISRDPNSLSYVSEPKPGLWVIAIDACRYKENTTSAITGGRLAATTMAWIQARLAEAKAQNKTVIGMMHHGVVEHFAGQATLFSEYLVEDYQNVATQLAQAGLHIMFTGHYHANDIAKYTSSGSYIFDIETGSTVTAPCPYRIVTLSKEGLMDVKTKLVSSVNYDLKGAKDFQTYANKFLNDGLSPLVGYMLKYQFNATDDQVAFATPYVVAGMMAHYAGDETPSATTLTVIQQMLGSDATKPLGSALYGIWTDIAPKDNNVVIDIKTGAVSKK